MSKKLSLGMIAALLLALFAFGASLEVNRSVFEHLPHLEDEFAYLYQAKIFAGGHAWVPRDEPVKVFWQPFVIQPETSPDGILRRFGKYTPAWPLILALGAAVSAPFVVNAFIAALTVVLIYRIGREIFDEAVGLVAALLMAISPMALLLNATLMSHTSALFFVMLFIYGYWRTTIARRGWRNRLAWGALAGIGLGVVVAMRPLTAIAMAAPVGLHALSRILDALSEKEERRKLSQIIAPLVVLAICMLPFIGLVFGFNYVVTGQARSELYTLLWDYDKPGFGAGYGLMPGGHTLEYGWRNARDDLGIWLRDLFGWTLDPSLAKYAADNWGWGAGVGLSWVAIVIGLIAGRKKEWIWLFFELFVAIVLAQLTYWIGSAVHGSAVYSIRYYFEATGGVVLVSAYGLVALARQWRSKPNVQTTPSESLPTNEITTDVNSPSPNSERGPGGEVKSSPAFATRLQAAWNTLWPGYILILVLAGASLIGYAPARFHESLEFWPDGLYRYNKIGRQQLDALNAMREPGKKVLVLVLHDPNPNVEDNWRDYGALMAMTSPYLDSDIVVARLFETDSIDEFKQRFSDRQVLYEVGEKLYRTPEEAMKSDNNDSKSGSS